MATLPPFGIVLPSRPLLTEPQFISQTQYAFSFPSLPNFSHIVVFLLPGFSMPQDTLAGVYIQLPDSGPDFQLLGAIGTNKQSAIFRVKKSGSGSETVPPEDPMTDLDDGPAMVEGQLSSPLITVGISIESVGTLSHQLQIIKASQSAPPLENQITSSKLSTKVLAQRIIANAFNFLASFAGSAGPGGVEDWWSKFERRIENDPGFLERDDR